MQLTHVVIFLILITCLSVNADSIYQPIDERIAKANLIVTGEVVAIESIKFPGESFPKKVIILKVENIQKGKLNSEYILISIGLIWPKNLSSSQDINIEKNILGKWLLNKSDTGLFILNRPDNFIPLVKN